LALAFALIATPVGHGAEPIKTAGKDFWSLQPPKVVEPPTPKNVAMSNTAIDQFLLAKLEAKGLTFSARAEPRAQVRRLYFDLIGLPPTPEVVDAFVKDSTDAAYAKLVDELLASPQYGERWARHWLDLARYGESDGFERNTQRPNSWHYRDWVIRAFNEDMPYDRFVKLQLAGDMLEPGNSDGLKATGFLVAGIHNTVIGSNPIMQQNARQEELEDIIGAVSQTFLGLSVQCARCHDHKFDPIPQKDYYRVSAALSGVSFGERPTRSPTVVAFTPEQIELIKQIATLDQKLATLDTTATDRIRAKMPVGDKKPVLTSVPFARWTFDKNGDDDSGKLKASLHGNARIIDGRLVLDGKDSYLSTSAIPKDVSEKTLEAWLRLPILDQGGGGIITLQTNDGITFDSIVYAERQRHMWMPGSNGYTRTQDPRGAAESAKPDELIHMAIVYGSDNTIATYRNGVKYGEAYKPRNPLLTFKSGESQVIFGLRHVGSKNGYLRAEIQEARLYDKALSAADVAASSKAGLGGFAPSPEELAAVLTAEEKKDRDVWQNERTKLEAKRPKPQPAPASEKVYAVVPNQPGATYLLARGNVERKRAEVTAGGVEALPGKSDFEMKSNTPEGRRRAKLAEWIARADNPLFARVIVNRLWHYHFGVGIVDTPSDFGLNGGRPSHPELLDWLANKLVAERFQLKAIHKLMVTSAAYRQASTRVPAAIAIDADNRLLWRKSPTRLDAEPLRDAMLAVAGQLNPKAGGPGYLDTKAYGNSGTTYYEPIDPPGADFQRRTIYRFSPRGERSAILETFDCPDPSAQTPRRQVTTTPLQALALWNNSLVLRMADRLSDRVTADCKTAGDSTTTAKVDRAYKLALGRVPYVDERKAASTVVDKHGVAALARVLFNCNEFVVIE